MKNVSQAAQYLGLSVHTIRKYIVLEKIPFYRLGGAIRFKTEDLDNWVANRKVGNEL